ncbi:hypothetical protein D3C71_1658320 [compost metagenome]
MLHPLVLCARVGIDAFEVVLSHVLHHARYPIDVLFDAHRHVGQRPGTAWSGHREHIWEFAGHETQIGLCASRPLAAERAPSDPAHIDLVECASERVIACSVDQDVEFVHTVLSAHAFLYDFLDRRGL